MGRAHFSLTHNLSLPPSLCLFLFSLSIYPSIYLFIYLSIYLTFIFHMLSRYVYSILPLYLSLSRSSFSFSLTFSLNCLSPLKQLVYCIHSTAICPIILYRVTSCPTILSLLPAFPHNAPGLQPVIVRMRHPTFARTLGSGSLLVSPEIVVCINVVFCCLRRDTAFVIENVKCRFYMNMFSA